jgi:hypothetical protein
MSDDFQVTGNNPAALFTLKVYRGDGMSLLAMNWKAGEPPDDFVGFAIEYKEPGGSKFFALTNRLSFPSDVAATGPNKLSTRLSPIQKFRWVHFPRNADLPGDFVYKVTPVFMNPADVLSYGDEQTVAIQLRRETFPGQLNVTFTRGFVSSQAFVDFYQSAGPISQLLPAKAADGLTFTPTHPKTKAALTWMGFEARAAILDVLDKAVADSTAQVRVVAYDLNQPDIVARLEKLGPRLKLIIDNSDDHGATGSAENAAEQRMLTSAGATNVKRQHMGALQHNKTIVVDGAGGQFVVCGSTNFSWRGFFVQSNNALILQGPSAVAPFTAAFDTYFSETPAHFRQSPSAEWSDLGLAGIDAKVAFSPHGPSNALLQKIADDIGDNTTSSLFYSLAFLYQTPGPVLDAIKKVTLNSERFVYGMSDRRVGGLDIQKPDGTVNPVFPSALAKKLPAPFKSEPSGGQGIRLHHKFVVIDFDQPSARVYLGSYNFSDPADNDNGENLLLIRDRRIAVSYLIEAIRLFDHYHFRVTQSESKKARKKLELAKPPRAPGEVPWWKEYWTVANKIRDREMFA